MLTTFRISAAALAIVLSVSATPARAADLPAADQQLPPGVVAYVSIPDVPQFKAKFAESSMGRLVRDPALDDFRSELSSRVQDGIAQAEQELGFSLADLANLPAGEAALAVIQPAGGELGLAVLLDVGERSEVLDKLLAKAEQALEQQEATRSESEISGTNVTVYSVPRPEGAGNAQGGPMTIAYFVKDGRFVAASNTRLVEEILERWNGSGSSGEETFAASEVYSYIISQCVVEGEESLLNWYFDPLGLLTGALGTSPQMAMQSIMVTTYAQMLGLKELRGVGGSMAMATGEFDSVSNMFVYVDQPTSGVLKVFDFPVTAHDPPAWAADDVTAYTSVNWDLESAYGAIEAVYDMFVRQPGSFGKMVDAFSKRADGPMLHIKNDLLAQFTGRIHMLTQFDESAGFNGQRILVALDVKDDAEALSIIDKIANTEGVPVQTREFSGTTVYESSQPSPGGMSPSAAVFDGHLLFSTHAEALEQILEHRAAERPLGSSAEFQQLAGHVPDQVSIFGFQKQDAQVRAVLEMLKSGQLDALTNGQFDFSTLPEFEAIQKYLSPTCTYVVPDEHGAKIVGFSLAPKE